jgi:hypothetical protein
MVFDHSGKYLYIATYDGHVWPYNLVSRQLETPYTFNGSLLGLEIAPDDSFLIAAQAIFGRTQGAFQKLDRNTGRITNLTYNRGFYEAGAWDVALASNGKALASTEFIGSGYVPLHQIDLASGAVSTRTDAPGYFGPGKVQQRAQLQRGSDRTRVYIFDSNLFTYSAVTDTFGSSVQTNTNVDTASIAINRNGSLLGTRLDRQNSASLETSVGFNLVHSFNGLDSGLTFDAARDRFYGINSSTDQIVGYDTNNFSQTISLQIGEDVSSGATQFGPGTLVASPDGRYLALRTPTGIQVYPIPPSSGPSLQIWDMAHLTNNHFVLQALALPNSSNTLKATTNLQTGFTAPGTTVTADPNGFIQFEDTNAGNATAKFYRITSP